MPSEDDRFEELAILQSPSEDEGKKSKQEFLMPVLTGFLALRLALLLFPFSPSYLKILQSGFYKRGHLVHRHEVPQRQGVRQLIGQLVPWRASHEL